jgi:K+-sensing histidine kinase KdpD
MDLKNQYCILFIDEISCEVKEKLSCVVKKTKMKLLDSISHELRTPLNCSIGMLLVLKRTDFVN